jgi:hypothetical protein
MRFFPLKIQNFGSFTHFHYQIHAGVHQSITSRHVTWLTKFSTEAPNICGPSACNLLHVTILAPRILK